MNNLTAKIEQARQAYNALALESLQRLETRRQNVAAMVTKETAKAKKKRG